MAVSLRVLTNINHELKERLNPNEIQSLRTKEGKEKHKETLQEIYSNVCFDVISEGNMLDGCLHSAVGYIKDQAMSFEHAEMTEGYGFGATKPDEIRKAVLSWNRNMSMEFIHFLKAFEKQAEQRGFRTLTEMFLANMTEDGQIQWDLFSYPASLYPLRKAMDAVDEVFTYGQNRIFYDTVGKICPCVPASVITQAREHPEDFLIIEVNYD